MKFPKPLKIKTDNVDAFPKCYYKAMETAAPLRYDVDIIVRVETYRTKEIVSLFETIFEWPMKLVDIEDKHDKRRVEKIIKLIKSGKPIWPYVSYWADTLEELMEVTQEYNEISVPNHGDGWHRLIAANELKLKTVDILF